MTDVSPILRTLCFARFGAPTDGRPSSYSFNDPSGMCLECEGLGQAIRVGSSTAVTRS